MIKAVFFDVDGTLISFKTHKMPESTKQSLMKLKENGIKVFLSTGRPKCDIKKVPEIVDFPFDGTISTNGQYCYDEFGKTIHQKFIDKQSVETIFSYLESKGLACHVITDENVYVTAINDRVLKLFDLVGYQEHPEVKPIEYFKDKNIFQLCPYITKEEEIELIENIPNCEAFRWCDLFIDVIPKGGGKSYGISKICEYYGIKQSETMAFGDGGNDVDMLKYVAIGIAMDNADDFVKESADYITTSVDDDGIFNALKHYELI